MDCPTSFPEQLTQAVTHVQRSSLSESPPTQLQKLKNLPVELRSRIFTSFVNLAQDRHVLEWNISRILPTQHDLEELLNSVLQSSAESKEKEGGMLTKGRSKKTGSSAAPDPSKSGIGRVATFHPDQSERSSTKSAISLNPEKVIKTAEGQFRLHREVDAIVYIAHDGPNYSNSCLGHAETVGEVKKRAAIEGKETINILAFTPYGIYPELYQWTWAMICRDLFGFPLKNTEVFAPRTWWLREHGWPILAKLQDVSEKSGSLSLS